MRSCLLALVVVFTLINCSVRRDEKSLVIEHYVRFAGGNEIWRQVRTITAQGTYDYGGIKFPFSSYAKAPDQYKFVVALNDKYYAQAFDGNKGWKIDAFKNETTPTFLSGQAARAMANEADVYLLNDLQRYQAGDASITLDGDTTIDHQPCAKLSGVAGSIWYIEKSSGALMARRSIAKNPELGGAVLFTRYSDYREQDGLKIPFRITHETNGQMVLSIVVDKVLINSEIKDSAFQPPVR